MNCTCCKCNRFGTIFRCNKWGKRENVSLEQVLDYLFLVLTAKEQCPMKGQKEKQRPALLVSTVDTCLSLVNIGNAPMPKVPRHANLVHCFQEDMLECYGHMGKCFGRFTVTGTFPILTSNRHMPAML